MLTLACSLPEPHGARVRARVPADVTATVERMASTDWVPLDVQMAVVEAVWEVLGEQRFREFSTELMVQHTRMPLLSGLVESAMRLMGTTPNALLKWLPRAWNVVCRDFGEAVYESLGPRSARLTFRGLPVRYATSRAAAGGLVGTCYGYLRVCRVEGAVTMDDSRAAVGELRYQIDWTE